jgi:hypothetical protein
MVHHIEYFVKKLKLILAKTANTRYYYARCFFC